MHLSRRLAVTTSLLVTVLLLLSALCVQSVLTRADSGPAARTTTAGSTGAPLRLPEPTGRYAVGRQDVRLVDHDRTDPYTRGGPRELMAGVWYPAARSAGLPRAPWMSPGLVAGFAENAGRLLGLPADRIDWAAVRTHAALGAPVADPGRRRPVILYSPGFGTSRSWGTVLVEELASRGFVVVTVDHTYEAFGVDFGGGRIAAGRPAGSGTETGLAGPMRVRAEDIRFVLAQLTRFASGAGGPLPRDLARSLDLSRIGMFGHSAGGVTTAETMARDSRIDAGLDLDGLSVTSAAKAWPGLRSTVRRGLDRPFLMLSSAPAAAKNSGSSASAKRAQNATPASEAEGSTLPAQLRARSPHTVTEERLADTGHYSFTDFQALLPQLRRGPGPAPRRVADLIGAAAPGPVLDRERGLTSGFFERILRPDRRPAA